MSCKALGIAIKLTLYGDNQLFKPETAAFAITLALCGMTQISYLNRVSGFARGCGWVGWRVGLDRLPHMKNRMWMPSTHPSSPTHPKGRVDSPIP